MASRRQFFTVLGSALALGPIAVWLSGRGGPAAESLGPFPVQKSDDEWRRQLTSQQYNILRSHSTERPYTSPLNDEKRRGVFTCAGCGQALFSSTTKFESGTGWPSFWEPLPDAVGTTADRSFLMVRTEV